ncbi:DNA-directed RNA polymerase subunit N [Infirmifilum sp. NZ]|uniref:DNA-directed RNA polymerase subunit N n=1 Tax=Infirmifilum sp. NZ TaxID=2926850 RepID=UPI000CB4DCC4|nr:DNA-directed RNA polymerase subunit N [Infirmifilum sp. NZ]PLJ76932.1 MAG: DNA-directed RNA polymerase subunit N [Thermofilum sp. NZ13]UNQ74232.1 DNA-directed RNA polymerase subunit N [Infirmifilum sp. NZ]
MMFPVRCFTCGSLIGDKWNEFATRVHNGEDPEKVLNDLGVKRYCCRRMFLSHVDLVDKILEYGTVEELYLP